MATVEHEFVIVGRGEYAMDNDDKSVTRIPWFEMSSPLGGEVIRATFGKDAPHGDLHQLPNYQPVQLLVELRGNGKRSILGLGNGHRKAA